MDRVVIVGASGSGKSTLARRLSERAGLTHIELDELFHGPDWTPTPTPEFRNRVVEAVTASSTAGPDPRWVVAGNYAMVSDITHGSADTIVWLDLSRVRCTLRVVRRSIGRVARRQQLWNGNRETVRDLVSRDPERNVVVHTWRSHPQLRARYEGFSTGPFWAHADVRRLRRTRDVERFVDSVPVTRRP